MKGKFRDRLVLPVFFGAILMLLHSNCVKKKYQLPKLRHVFCLQRLFCSSVAPVLRWSSTLAVDHGGRTRPWLRKAEKRAQIALRVAPRATLAHDGVGL